MKEVLRKRLKRRRGHTGRNPEGVGGPERKWCRERGTLGFISWKESTDKILTFKEVQSRLPVI